jgi:hypothetical protein
MGTKRFAISFRDLDTISTWLTTLLGGGPDRSRVEVDPEEIRVRMGGVRANIPQGSVHHIVLTVWRGPHLGFDEPQAHCQRDRCCRLPFPVR